jgi:hypothetical protein
MTDCIHDKATACQGKTEQENKQAGVMKHERKPAEPLATKSPKDRLP